MLKLINGAEKIRDNLMSTTVYLNVLIKSVEAYLNWLNEYPRLPEEQTRCINLYSIENDKEWWKK